MKRILSAVIVCSLLLLSPRASAELAFGPGLGGALYSGDGEARVEALFGDALAISPGETLREETRLRLPYGGPVYLLYPGLPGSLKDLILAIRTDVPIFEGTLGSADFIYLGSYPENTDIPLTFTLRMPEKLSWAARRDWPGLHWLLIQSLPQQPPTGDLRHPEIAAAVAFTSAAGLAAILPGQATRRRIRGGKPLPSPGRGRWPAGRMRSKMPNKGRVR